MISVISVNIYGQGWLAANSALPQLILGINRVFNTGHFLKYAMYLAAIAKLIVIPAV
jgi:hypothetical protein